MTERILVPYDGTDHSKRALEYAIETVPDASLLSVYVVPTPSGMWASFEEPEKLIPGYQRAHDRGEKLLEEAAATAADHGRDLETELYLGNPKRVIVDRAAEPDVDAVVIGSHGRDGVARVLLGSVAETVVRRSPVPVTTVR